MKKHLLLIIACIFTVTLSFSTPVFAEIDLSGMTFDELVALKEQIDLAIWQSEEWQEVSVPTGLYLVGEDIPAGKWTIIAPEGSDTYVKWGDEPDETGTSLKKFKGNERIYSPSDPNYEANQDRTQLDIELYDGLYLYVEDGVAVFTPFTGKPSLGFK